MTNAKLSINGNILTIEVDLSKDNGPSKTGKTRIIASTEGNVNLNGIDEKHAGKFVGLNIYKKG